MPGGFADTSPWPSPAGFDEIKSAQISAYLAQQSPEPVDKLKLIKLIYLAEREYLDRYSLPMTLDQFWSMKDGPVASAALNGLDGLLNQNLWDIWIDRSARNKIKSHIKRNREEFNHLSNADISVLDKIWEQFGPLTTPQIWKYVHSKCPEYRAVTKGRHRISYRDILRVLKKENPEAIEENILVLQREAAFI